MYISREQLDEGAPRPADRDHQPGLPSPMAQLIGKAQQPQEEAQQLVWFGPTIGRPPHTRNQHRAASLRLPEPPSSALDGALSSQAQGDDDQN